MPQLKAFFITLCIALSSSYADERLNILWICVEDASPHISCYGEKAIQTTNIDQLASEGILFEKAFVTAPVCSTSRSAMVSGMFQTTSGYLHHRSQRAVGKGGGNKNYVDSYQVPTGLKLVPQIFKEQGYYVSNATKTDYNFEIEKLYDSNEKWLKRVEGQPFFTQIQLKGGKGRKHHPGVDKNKITLPPYYPDTEVIREDWAKYLGSWMIVDQAVKNIVDTLKKNGELERTAIFFWTDHGVSHIRGKQFLYEEGIQVPLIIRFPKQEHGSTRRHDMVSHIDIPVTSLQVAGIEVPDYMQGKSLFSKDYQKQAFIYTARDRCDETVDILRSVRTDRFKYIRNYLPHCSHMQRSQYKEGKAIVQNALELHRAGQLNAIQGQAFQATRPIEELYDLKNDPHETVNLALNPEFQSTLLALRNNLKQWMIESKDMGLIPEPILEDLGKKYGSKYAILKAPENKNLVSNLIEIIEAGEQGDVAKILKGLKSERPSIRYWAYKALGNLELKEHQAKVIAGLKDADASVRISAAESLAQLGQVQKASEALKQEITHPNLIVGMYAIRALEAIGIQAKDFSGSEVHAAVKNDYEFTRRVAKRLVKEWNL